MAIDGIYESLITRAIKEKLDGLELDYYINKQPVENAEAAKYLSGFLSLIINRSIESLPNSDDRLQKQIELSNSLINWLSVYLNDNDITEDLIDSQGQMLMALFSKKNPASANFNEYLEKITPKTGLTQSELFTGSNQGLSLDSELKREILSSDEICWIVSFVKWTGIRIFTDTLKDAVNRGVKIRIITTSYMGATDQKAVDFLSRLPNTEVRLSYNTDRDRLHAKAYLFIRNNGFDTGYIGSSNLSHAALTNGLEWNLKITTQEIPHIIEKFKSTFETYWQSKDFEPYDADQSDHHVRLKKALDFEGRGQGQVEISHFYFDIEPHAYQKEMLEKLKVERSIYGRNKNLLVAATGTGKTLVSAFDFKEMYFKNRSAKLLFVAHREEILTQAISTFRAVLRDNTFGELWVGSNKPQHFRQLFASVQTLNNNLADIKLDQHFFDFIIVDEVHHISAESYRPIINYFAPQILLGLTATPERHDGTDITEDFCGVIAAELRLPEAITLGHLCPFQYFGVDDPIDLSNVSWIKGRYLPSELTGLFTADDVRFNHIIRSMEDILVNLNSIKALAFCVSQDHAKFMAEKFCLKGLKASYLTSENSENRIDLRLKLKNGEINILCVVDIFNEGIDLPEIDTVLFLRPTESLTIFLQQLGRGLRKISGKEYLTVLDFVGNAHAEYDFSKKFRSLVGKTHNSIKEELEEGFPSLPVGCSIILQKQAKETILRNINGAIINKNKLISSIKLFSSETSMDLNIANFLKIYPNISLDDIYKTKINKGGGWCRLCVLSGLMEDNINPEIERAIYRCIFNRLLQCSSISYLKFIYQTLKQGTWDLKDEEQNQMVMMMHYDFWQKSVRDKGFDSLEDSLQLLRRDSKLINECLSVIEVILESMSTLELDMEIGFKSAIKLHSRYTRDQILAAFGENGFDIKSSSQEGVVEIKGKNTELLFVTLQKTSKRFSPSTLYHDYAISELLFHWQSQNSARPDKGKGLSYVLQSENKKTIILFVREKSKDHLGRSMGFINLGPVKLENHKGSKPMNITWKLSEPIPPYLWHDAAKLAVG
jgi:superfamily II DNA or RNA helicase